MAEEEEGKRLRRMTERRNRAKRPEDDTLRWAGKNDLYAAMREIDDKHRQEREIQATRELAQATKELTRAIEAQAVKPSVNPAEKRKVLYSLFDDFYQENPGKRIDLKQIAEDSDYAYGTVKNYHSAYMKQTGRKSR